MSIVVTGARGFLGGHVVDSLTARGADVSALGRQDGDLRNYRFAETLLREADTIVHLAADVGGVGYLRSASGRAFHDNLRLGLNVIRAACRGRCKRLVLAGTPCAYAGDAALPLSEEALEVGVPSGDTGSYGYAKLVCSVTARDVCGMHGIQTVTVIPANLYGPRDAFDKERGHVVAALIRKALVAAERGMATFDVWGDGTATRDFVYVTDVAEAIAHVASCDTAFDGEVFNLGSGRETSIREIAETVARAVGKGVVPEFQPDRPVGYRRRVMAVDRATRAFGYRPRTGLEQGIQQTVAWLRGDGDRVARWAAEDMRADGCHATAKV